MRGAAIRIVVHDHVAGTKLVAALFEALADAADVSGDGTGLQRRAHLAFAELAPLRVRERRAEILRLADDARIAHAHELVAHLDGDAFKRALDHRAGDRVDPRIRLFLFDAVCVLHQLSLRVSVIHRDGQDQIAGRVVDRAAARWNDRRRVLLQHDGWPGEDLADRQEVTPVEAGLERAPRAVDAEHTLAGAHARVLQGRALGRRKLGDLRHLADADNPQVHNFDRARDKSVRVFALVRLVEACPNGRQIALADHAFGEGNLELIALPHVTQIAVADER